MRNSPDFPTDFPATKPLRCRRRRRQSRHCAPSPETHIIMINTRERIIILLRHYHYTVTYHNFKRACTRCLCLAWRAYALHGKSTYRILRTTYQPRRREGDLGRPKTTPSPRKFKVFTPIEHRGNTFYFSTVLKSNRIKISFKNDFGFVALW